MKIVLTVIGALGALAGAIWALQGLAILPAILPPARLEGHIALVGNGVFLIAASAMLIVWAQRGRPQPKS